MTPEDIKVAIKAYRFTCPHGSHFLHLDGTVTASHCFGIDGRKNDYKCEGRICKRLREFINILKEPRE